MIQEALVIFACLNKTGCSETSYAYYQSNPEIRHIIDTGEKVAYQYLGPVFIQTIGPIIYVAAGGEGSVRISGNFNLQLTRDTGTLLFKKEF